MLARSSVVWCLVIGLAVAASAATTDTAREHAQRGREAIARGETKTAESELRQAVQLAPRDAEFLALLGVVLGMQQKLQESDVYLEKALRIDPTEASTRRNLAWNQFQLGLLAPAKSNLERILEQKPGDQQATLILGMVDEELKEYRAAISLLESVPQQVRQRSESRAALARAYYHVGRADKASETLEELRHQTAGPEGIFLGGQVAAEMHDFKTAQSLFGSIRSTYPDTGKLGYNLALAEYNMRQFSSAEATLRGVISAGRIAGETYNLLAWCLYKQDDFKGAAAALDKAIALDPADETNYLDGGMMLLEHHIYGPALDAAEKTLEVAPESYRGQRLKALVELKMGRVNDAEEHYRRAVELNPGDAQAITGLATAQLDKGNSGEAEETLKKAIERLPREALLYQAYGSMLLWGEGEDNSAYEDRAVALLRKAISLDGTLAEAHYQLGKLALRQDRVREAQRELEAAVKLDSRSSKNHYAMAQVFRKLGRTADAAHEVAQFQALKTKEERTFMSISAAQGSALAPASEPRPPVTK